MGDLTTDQIFVLARDGASVLLWATVALALVPRLRDGEWAPVALVGSILLLATSGLDLVQAKLLFVDLDPSLTFTLAGWHATRVPTLLAFVGIALLAKAVLTGRPRRAAATDPAGGLEPQTPPGSGTSKQVRRRLSG